MTRHVNLQIRSNGDAARLAAILEDAAGKLRTGYTCDYQPPTGGESYYWELIEEPEGVVAE